MNRKRQFSYGTLRRTPEYLVRQAQLGFHCAVMREVDDDNRPLDVPAVACVILSAAEYEQLTAEVAVDA